MDKPLFQQEKNFRSGFVVAETREGQEGKLNSNSSCLSS